MAAHFGAPSTNSRFTRWQHITEHHPQTHASLDGSTFRCTIHKLTIHQMAAHYGAVSTNSRFTRWQHITEHHQQTHASLDGSTLRCTIHKLTHSPDGSTLPCSIHKLTLHQMAAHYRAPSTNSRFTRWQHITEHHPQTHASLDGSTLRCSIHKLTLH